jgi:serine protease
MGPRHYASAAALLLSLAAPGAATASDYSPSHVIVRYAGWTTHRERIAVERATGTGRAVAVAGGARILRIKDRQSVRTAIARLRRQPGVDYAVPDYRVRAAASAYFPNDPGRGGAGNWRKVQWNFAGPFGIHAPRAWGTMRALHEAGGRGVIVAVIDSGVAYTSRGQFKRAPDLGEKGFVPGHDFIDGDNVPLDEDGHGTHVAGTIAEQVNNRKAVTGLAYGVKIMPLRVLDANGGGDGSTLGKAIIWAVDHGAQVINMSIVFNADLQAADIPDVIAAMNYAHEHNVVMVGAAGNDSDNHIDYPARYRDVISVGATTSSGCKAGYSSFGNGLDVVAPGGGDDADLTGSAWDRAHCGRGDGREIFQQTFVNNYHDFHLVGVEGTSEAAPHVTAIAALIIASGRLGQHPTADAVLTRIEKSARDVGPPGYDKHYGYGLVDAAAAVAP